MTHPSVRPGPDGRPEIILHESGFGGPSPVSEESAAAFAEGYYGEQQLAGLYRAIERARGKPRVRPLAPQFPWSPSQRYVCAGEVHVVGGQRVPVEAVGDSAEAAYAAWANECNRICLERLPWRAAVVPAAPQPWWRRLLAAIGWL